MSWEAMNDRLLTGIAIGVERTTIRMRQETLCEGICSVRTLRSIEKGRAIVKDSTYAALLERLGYASDPAMSGISVMDERLKQLHRDKSQGLGVNPLSYRCIGGESSSSNLYAALFVPLLQGFSDSEGCAEHQTRTARFLTLGFEWLPVYMQDLALDFLFRRCKHTFDEQGMEEIALRMQHANRDYAPHVLSMMERNASSRNYRTVVNAYEAAAEKWEREGLLGALLAAQEIVLIPVAFSEPGRLDEQIALTENTFARIRQAGLELGAAREASYRYNMGLACAYAKKYGKAHAYFAESCAIARQTGVSMKIDEVLLEYTWLRLTGETADPLVPLAGGVFPEPCRNTHPYRREYDYFYYKNKLGLPPKELQKYILEHILPLNMDGTDILYQVFLYEMLQLSRAAQSYIPLQVYVETVNR